MVFKFCLDASLLKSIAIVPAIPLDEINNSSGVVISDFISPQRLCDSILFFPK